MKKITPHYLLSGICICASLLTSSCIQPLTKVEVFKNKTESAILSASVSQVAIKNNQVIIKGANLSNVTSFKISGYSQTFKIISKESHQMVVEPDSAIALKLDTVLNFVLGTANAAATIPVQIDLSVPGAQANDFLQFDGVHWNSASINGLNYKGTWDATSGSDPTTSAQPGDYYIVSKNGTHSLNGISSWTKGDWVVYADSGIGWQKIDNSTGTFNLTALGDVQITSPVNNQVLSWNGSKWVNQTMAITETDPTVKAFAKANLPACSGSTVLKSDGTSFSCVTVATVDWSSPGVQTIEPSRINLTGANKVVITNGSGVPGSSTVTSSELLYLSGVTSNIQTQLNGKISTETDPSVQAFAKSALPTCTSGQVLKSNGTSFSCVTDATGGSGFSGTANRIVSTDSSGALTVTGISDTVLGYLSGVTSSVQTQLDSKQGTISKTSNIEVSTMKVYGSNSTNYVTITAPTLSSNVNFKLPEDNGTANDVLKTDGNGNLSWTAQSTGAVFSGTASKAVATDGSGALTTVTTTATELGYVAGVTSAIQSQIDSKQAALTSATHLLGDDLKIYNGTNYVELKAPSLSGNVVFTLPSALGSLNQILKTDASGNLSWANAGSLTVDWTSTGAEVIHPTRLNMGAGNGGKALVTDASANVVTSAVTSAELGYVSGVTSSIQTQIDSKLASSNFVDWSTTGVQTIAPSRLNLTTANRVVVTNGSGVPVASSISDTILGYLSTVSSNVQTQIDNLATSLTAISGQTPNAWDEKTTAFTAVKNGRYLINTSGAAFTMTLPASANLGDTITIVDATGSFDTKNLTIARNGLKIMGLAEDMTVANKNISFELVYYDATNGWRIK